VGMAGRTTKIYTALCLLWWLDDGPKMVRKPKDGRVEKLIRRDWGLENGLGGFTHPFPGQPFGGLPWPKENSQKQGHRPHSRISL